MRIGHIVNLAPIGGLELQFAEFLAHSKKHFDVQHSIMLAEDGIHELLDEKIRGLAYPIAQSQHILGHRLHWKRRRGRRMLMRLAAYRMQPDVQLFWSRLAGNNHAVAEATAFDSRTNVLWDRGASWLAPDNWKSRAMLDQMGHAIANSHASRRMLELRWQFDRPITVCRNALRPSVQPASQVVRTLPTGRPYILGIAARLVSLKGIASALHAVARARVHGLDVELHIAGNGDQSEPLKRLTEKLGLAENVVYLGLVEDMAVFYQSIDCLIHLALREPFGQVLVEAMAHGCPVIATSVDGMVEIVRDGVDGYLVPATMEMSEYAAIGASIEYMPPYVFDPAEDVIRSPRAVEPDVAADRIAAIFADPVQYERMSASALARVRNDFRFEDHVEAVLACLSRISAE